MAGRRRLFEETEVLEKAMNVFWKKGYEATSTEDLLSAMDLNKGSLYNTFNSKKDLFIKVVDHFGDFLINTLEHNIQAEPNALDGIKNVFRNICNDTPEDRERGCFLGNSVSELSNIDEDMERKAILRLKSMQSLFERHLQRAQEQGDIDTGSDIRKQALHLVNLWNGLYVTLRMYDLKDLKEMIEMNLKLLK